LTLITIVTLLILEAWWGRSLWITAIVVEVGGTVG